MKSPSDLFFYSVVIVKYWAGLNYPSDQDGLRRGADDLMVFSKEARWWLSSFLVQTEAWVAVLSNIANQRDDSGLDIYANVDYPVNWEA